MTSKDEQRECTHAPGEHILISARKSEVKGRKRRGVSILQQIDEEGIAYAASQGCYHPFMAIDEDVSGDIPAAKRPGLGPYLTNIEMRAWSELVGINISRLGRNALDARRTRDRVASYGKKVTVLTPLLHYPTENMMEKQMWAFLENFAEMELDNIKLANNKARALLRKNGAVRGRLCWGFKVTGEEGSKLPTLDESKRKYLLIMIEMAEAGNKLPRIAERLDAEAAKDQNALPKYEGKWAPRTIGGILRNELLYGVYREGHKVTHFTSVIDRDRWRKLQWILDNKPTPTPDQWEPREPTQREKDPWTLSDVIHCPKCGGVMHKREKKGWVRKDGTFTVYRYYRCDGTPRQRSTCQNAIPAEEIERRVNEQLLALWADETIKVVSWRPANDHAGEIEDIRAEIDALDNTDRETYLPEYNRLMDEIDRLERDGAVPAGVETNDSQIKFGVYWSTLTDKERHDYLVRARVKVMANIVRPEKEREAGTIVGGFSDGDNIDWWIEGDPRVVVGELTKKVIPDEEPED